MNRIYFTTIIIVILFSACNKSNKVFYKNGGIMSEYYIVNDKIEGVYKEYYESGELKFVVNYKKGVINGEKKSFYKDGKIKSIENFTENQLNGDCRYFSNSGKIDSIKSYFMVNPQVYKADDEESYFKLVRNVFDSSTLRKKSQLNSVLRIDKDGNVEINRSHYFEIALKKDTINLKDSMCAVLLFKYRRDGEKTKFRVIQFVNEKMDLYNVYDTDHESIYLKEKPQKRGVNYIRGWIEEYTPYGFDTLRNVLFFEKKYFAK